MVLVPIDTPGVTVLRAMPVFGYQDREGHCEILFDDVRVPTTNLLGEEGGGFAMAQARLGPGRIHHCMRTIGAAERALELLCRRVQSRVAFGKRLAEQGVIQEWIADSRIELEQVRLLTLKTAWLMDTVGNKGAAIEIAAIKVAAPNAALRVIARPFAGGELVLDDPDEVPGWDPGRPLALHAHLSAPPVGLRPTPIDARRAGARSVVLKRSLRLHFSRPRSPRPAR